MGKSNDSLVRTVQRSASEESEGTETRADIDGNAFGGMIAALPLAVLLWILLGTSIYYLFH